MDAVNLTEAQHMNNPNIQNPCDVFTFSDYLSLMKELGQPAFRAKQLAQWLWVHEATNYDEMSNLPADLRTQLVKAAPLKRASVRKVQHSKDGTRKYLLCFADGVCVEAVGLPSNIPSSNVDDVKPEQRQRLSVCVSSQAGCSLGCTFCATGQGGLVRNLLPGEIAEQVRIVAADFGIRASSIVIMGQGEPFQNYDAVLAGLRILNTSTDDGGFGIGARHITISTAGIIKGIDTLATEPEQFTLAVSLHSAVQTTRDKIMPGLRGQSLEKLRTALVDYYKQTGRRPSLEYALIDEVNVNIVEITALKDFAQTTKAHVNLIPLNTTSSNLESASQLKTTQIAKELRDAGINVTIRKERGSDIAAACGQLTQEKRG